MELPNLFLFSNGSKVKNLVDWHNRRVELIHIFQEIEYGYLPPAPLITRGEILEKTPYASFPGAIYERYRLISGPEPVFEFLIDLHIPPSPGPFSVALTGDACWNYVTPEIIHEGLSRGFILAQFDRTMIVPDAACPERNVGLYKIFPGMNFGALAAWAWGYHRCIDFLTDLTIVDSTRIAVVGHSRGGKTALLAGGLDERIALTAPNDSGCAGAGCFRFQGEGSETLRDIFGCFPYWFSPRLADFVDRENALPLDQHFLKALIAPRYLLSTEALGDIWANPSGTWLTHLAAQEAFRFLGVEDRIAIWYREGGHNHGLEDWKIFLDFALWKFYGSVNVQGINRSPFMDLPAAFEWRAPL